MKFVLEKVLNSVSTRPDQVQEGLDPFSEWLGRRGYHVIQTASSRWYQSGPRVYQAFPYHWVIDPGEDELRQLLCRHKAIGLRYSSPFHSSQGAISYHVVYTDQVYSLDALPKKARYDVRKGLSCTQIEPVSFSKLATEGWQAREETLLRQGRVGAENRIWWEKLCLSANDLSGFEVWAAITDGVIVASLLAFTNDGCCSILYQQSMTEHLRNGVNNALTYKFTEDILRRKKILSIFYGLHSLDAPASVDAFKFRMRYTARPVRQRVVFHPALRPLVNRASHKIIRQLLRYGKGNATLDKAEGMFRFALEGKRPLAEQVWPEALADQKAELLSSL